VDGSRCPLGHENWKLRADTSAKVSGARNLHVEKAACSGDTTMYTFILNFDKISHMFKSVNRVANMVLQMV
jgi:hypothetical protein